MKAATYSPITSMPCERTRRKVSHPEWSDVRRHLHLRIEDAAMVLNATTKYLRLLCRQNDIPYWPGKKIRSLNAMGRKHTMEADSPEISARAGLGFHAAETNGMVEDDMIRVRPDPPLITNHPPEELTTLNLIDKVGLPSTSE